jgi:acyl carrier protein
VSTEIQEPQEQKRQEILAFVAHVIEDVVGMELGEEINLNTLVGPDGLGLESIGALEVTVHLEREYDIEFSDEMVQSLLSEPLGAFIDQIIQQCTAVAADASTESSDSQ